MDSSLLTSLIAAGSATGGILLKMAYDATLERIKIHKEQASLFLEERRKLYDRFLELNSAEIKYRKRLEELSLIARSGRRVKPEVLEQFPTSPMQELLEALEAIRRLARTGDLVKIAERIVALHGDASAAMRFYVTTNDLTYGLPLFLVNRLGEDQLLEFAAAYRKDLGIGPPEGSRRDFPRVDHIRPVPIEAAEQTLRLHLRPHKGSRTELPWPGDGAGKPLTEQDVRLLETPKYKAMLLEER